MLRYFQVLVYACPQDQRAISRDDPEFHEIMFLSSLCLPSKVGTANKKKKKEFTVKLEKVFCLYIQVWACSSWLQMCVSWACCMNVFVFGSTAEVCNVRQSYGGISDLNRRHLVAGEALGDEYC